MTARELFFKTLHRGGFRDMRGIPTDKNQKTTVTFGFSTQQDLSPIQDFIQHCSERNLNLFVGVAERTHMNGRGLKDCGALRVVFIDLDFKAVDEATARAALAQCPFPPTMVVFTGGGLHAYWVLDTPFDLTKESALARQVLLALAKKLGADTAAATPERILRVPGTINFKYRTLPEAKLEVCTDASYPLDKLMEWLGPLPKVEEKSPEAPYKHNLEAGDRIQRAKKWLIDQDPAIQGSGGDQTTYIICCFVTRGFDLNEDQAYSALQEWNARCEPPWSLDGGGPDSLRSKIQNAIQHATGQVGEMLNPKWQERQMVGQLASQIEMKPMHWLWENRLPLGAFSLLAGREGIGKSMLAYHLVGEITNGRLSGTSFRTARAVAISATEDSWEHTIKPRLVAAGANLNLVHRVEMRSSNGINSDPAFPSDIFALERYILRHNIALVLFDPIMSRLESKLDTHKDADVRKAIEPLGQIAERTQSVALGIIHVNKTATTDLLNSVMGSKAFVAVARSVLYVMVDGEDSKKRMVGVRKSNNAQEEETNKIFHIDNTLVANTPDGPIYTGKLVWDGDTNRSMVEEAEMATNGTRAAAKDAEEWLNELIESRGGYIESRAAKDAAKRRHSANNIERAMQRLKVNVVSRGFPRRTWWILPGHELPPEEQKLKEEKEEM